ncbi:MAG: FkbM family methyltransferase [Bacteroidota bacterium]
MLEQQKLRFASLLYKYVFPVYRILYFNFKNKKDRHHLSLIRKLIKPGFQVLDIGGNIGFFTKFLAKSVGSSGHVYSFEPDKTNFSHLKKELLGNNNVTLVQKAVAAESGSLTLYTSSLLNVDHRTYKPENYTGSYTVEKVAIDEFVSDRFKIDFIKMDIQGFEKDALKGMEKTLQANPGIILFTEFWPYGLSQAGSSAVEVYDLLAGYGFLIYKVDAANLIRFTREDAATMKVEYFTDANVIASRNEISI